MLHILNKRKYLCFLLVFFAALTDNSYAQSIKCNYGKITVLKNKHLSEKNTELCFLYQNKKKYFISKMCNSTCQALEIKKIAFDWKDLLSERTNPLFKLCSKLGGNPLLVTIAMTIKKQKYQHNTDKCVFKDKSFVATDYLMKLYRKML